MGLQWPPHQCGFLAALEACYPEDAVQDNGSPNTGNDPQFQPNTANGCTDTSDWYGQNS